MKPHEKYKPPSNHDDLALAICVAIILVVLWATTGCISFQKPSGPEPKWAPMIYDYSPIDSRCSFLNPPSGSRIDCDNPAAIKNYLLVPSDSIPPLIEKFDACEVWH